MYSFLWVAFSIISISAALERNSPCLTPNRENALCIPIDSCPPITTALKYLNKDAVEFAKLSQCGHDGFPLVCCGSVGSMTTTVNTLITTVTPKPTTTTRARTTARPYKASTEINPSVVPNNLPDKIYCGVQKHEIPIESGKNTVIYEFPWMVSLRYTAYDGSSGGLRCTGTLINRRYVLTAAECLNIQGFDLVGVTLGKWNHSQTHDCFQQSKNKIVCGLPINLSIDEDIPHPYYHKGNSDNNIALLRLSEDVEYDDFIHPICLPSNNFTKPASRTIFETSGWKTYVTGSQWDVKLKGKARIIQNKRCEELYRNFTQTHPNSACIEQVEESDLCIDNSGSPLMKLYSVTNGVEDFLRWYQEGIVYKGLGCHQPHLPASYTRVSKHLYWILRSMRQ